MHSSKIVQFTPDFMVFPHIQFSLKLTWLGNFYYKGILITGIRCYSFIIALPLTNIIVYKLRSYGFTEWMENKQFENKQTDDKKVF